VGNVLLGARLLTLRYGNLRRTIEGGKMLLKCSNPECEAPFDYREGRLIRFSTKGANGKSAENHTFIQHFWLCGECAGLYVIEHESGISVKIKPRQKELSTGKLSHFVSVA
jgi:hypothetical protein